jgi:hypothetical protein
MSGHFSAFKNREKSIEIKKFSRRDSLVSRKSNLIEYGSFGNEGDKNFPLLTKEELEKVKNEIKESIQSKRRKNNFIFGVSFFIIITILIFLSKKYNLI